MKFVQAFLLEVLCLQGFQDVMFSNLFFSCSVHFRDLTFKPVRIVQTHPKIAAADQEDQNEER